MTAAADTRAWRARGSVGPLYYFRHISVRADDGVVALTGYVWSPDALYRARQVARDVPGVRRVVTTNLEMELEGRGNGVSR